MVNKYWWTYFKTLKAVAKGIFNIVLTYWIYKKIRGKINAPLIFSTSLEMSIVALSI